MICESCQDAGDLHTSLATNTPTSEDELNHFVNEVEELHKQCLGATHCNCQHRIGKWIATREEDSATESSHSG